MINPYIKQSFVSISPKNLKNGKYMPYILKFFILLFSLRDDKNSLVIIFAIFFLLDFISSFPQLQLRCFFERPSKYNV